jgi:hypothetical protein
MNEKVRHGKHIVFIPLENKNPLSILFSKSFLTFEENLKITKSLSHNLFGVI